MPAKIKTFYNAGLNPKLISDIPNWNVDQYPKSNLGYPKLDLGYIKVLEHECPKLNHIPN